MSSVAQSSPAVRILGVVTDSTGKPIGGATITFTNTDTGVATSRQTSVSGAYSISPMQPGPYHLEAAAKGYERLPRINIVVDPTHTTQVFDVKLQIPDPHVGAMPGDAAGGGKANTTPQPAAVPLFRDPIHDGAADPVVVWNRARKTWWMLYTNRRADLADSNGVTWVHGTHIGIAESADGGAHWKYVSEADIPLPAPDYTLWAPEVIDTGGLYHMFLTVVPGTFSDWQHPRHILHLTSKDLLHWKPLENANLESDRTIDACVFRMPDGNWRLWYKNEADSSKVYFSDSPDLVHWTPKGIATTNHGEGPVVFQWHGHYWLINDPHAGLAVFRSDSDALTTWKQQPDNLLRVPGTQPTDRAMGNHADVVVDGSSRAWLFYFTGQGGPDAEGHDRGWARHSFLHVTELHEQDGVLTVDRNAPAYIHMLPPPKNKKSDIAKAWSLPVLDRQFGTAGSAPQADASRAPSPLRPSGPLPGMAISAPQPVYPSTAKAANVQGVVVLHVTISKEGRVEHLQIVGGPPMLQSAAADAVKQWRYMPYLVKGEPAEVETTINVNFSLSGGATTSAPAPLVPAGGGP
jgi:TonB family protein